MTVPLRVLIAEDSEDDALLLVRELKRGGYDPIYKRVASAAAMTAALDHEGWDLVIGDHSMPHFSGLAALALVRERGLDVPFICVSGTITEEMAVAAMKAGASDWVTKGQLKRLLPAIERELREAKGRAALRAIETGFAALVERSPIGIYRSTPEGRFLSANAAVVRLLGYASVTDVLGLDLAHDVYADPAERQRLLERDASSDRECDEVEATWKRQDGRLLTVQLNVRAVRNSAREVEYYETLVRDVTEQRSLERQLAQAQKMEAVGRLAGGIAHDFNNLLTVITSYSDLLLQDLPNDDPRRDDVEQVRRAAESAASLTRQLLAFSRQQVLEPKVVNLNDVVRGVEKMLQRLVGEDVSLVTLLAPNVWSVKADVGQLEQVLMNLSANARDAMPTGGKLTIETSNVVLDADYVRTHHTAAAGQFAMLAVSDTGVGMDEATKGRIFEPFFTTKEVGKGTGLGLATVYGIVEQSGGFVWLYSEPGRGTTFKIYLPQVNEAAELETLRVSSPLPRGDETILLVEDAPAVRVVTRQILERQGYAVLEVPDAAAGLRIAEKHQGPIHLLVTDVVMPGVSGRELAEQLTKLRAEMQVLYVSGYTDGAVVRHGVLEPGIAYLQKPFTPDGLARKVRQVLDAAGTRGSAPRVHQAKGERTGACILVIDDDADVRGAIRRYLDQAGYDVIEAADGAAGLRLYRERGADVVVVDIYMPERDGLELIRDLRAEARSPNIVAMSGGGKTGEIEMLKAAAAFGAARTLSKPVALKDLVATVRDLLRHGAEGLSPLRGGRC